MKSRLTVVLSEVFDVINNSTIPSSLDIDCFAPRNGEHIIDVLANNGMIWLPSNFEVACGR